MNFWLLKGFTWHKGRTVSHLKDYLFLFGFKKIKSDQLFWVMSKIAMSVGFSLPRNLVVSSYQNTFLHCVNTDFPLCICSPLLTLITSLSPALLSIGIWYNILSGMGKFSVIINVSIMQCPASYNLHWIRDEGTYARHKCMELFYSRSPA